MTRSDEHIAAFTPQTASADSDEHALVGRDREVSVIHRLLSQSQSAGASLLIRGEAGIGKSALLRIAERDAAAAGYRVLRCHGLEQASPVGFAALHELIRPLLTEVGVLPSRQRDALTTIFGITEGAAPDRLLVGVAVLGLIEEAASQNPVLLAVEDAHWLDRATAQVISFLSTRLEGSPILLLATARPSAATDDISLASETLVVDPLNDESSRILMSLMSHGISGASRMRILREAGGNPLALRELTRALRQGGTRAGLRSVLPTTQRLEDAFLGQLGQVPQASRDLLLLAAVADDANVADVLDAAKSMGLSPDDLDPLEDEGLLRVVGDRPVFRHPLLRAAIQGSAPSHAIRQAHAALADAVRDTARSAWHRASSTIERDERVAREMEAAANRARNRGALDESAAGYQRAAALSEDNQRRGFRLAMAADAARAAGLGAEALEILDQAEGVVTDPDTLATLATVRNTLSLTTGLGAYSQAELASLDTTSDGRAHPDRRVELLWGSAMVARARNLPVREWTRIETSLRRIDSDSPLKPVALALLAPQGGVDDDIRSMLPQLVSELIYDPLHMVSLAVAAESLHDLETALTCWGLARERFHEIGAPADEVQALRGRAGILLLRGRIREGLADAELGARMAHDTAQPLMETMCLATAARAYAVLGEPTATDDALGRMRSLVNVHPLAMASADARWAAGIVALAQNRYRDALIEFTHMAVHPTRALWAIADRTEVAVRAGRPESVSANLAAAARVSRVYRSSFLSALVERSYALIAEAESDSEATREHFSRAVQAGELSESAFELARTHLLFGEWLRRERHPVEAREHLSIALGVFDSVDAKMLAERASSELRAAGALPRKTRADVQRPTTSLTAQELQVAVLAARGMSNKQIADRIYLSHRTVSTHLYKVFPKLGITSRSQLRDALAKDGHTA